MFSCEVSVFFTGWLVIHGHGEAHGSDKGRSRLTATAPGYVEFRPQGKTMRMYPMMEGDKLFFVFRGLTSEATTYQGGRFLTIDPMHDRVLPPGVRFDVPKLSKPGKSASRVNNPQLFNSRMNVAFNAASCRSEYSHPFGLSKKCSFRYCFARLELPITLIGMPCPGWSFLLAILLSCISQVSAQEPNPGRPLHSRSVDGSAFGEGIEIPASSWLFSSTDKRENASPALDDRSWKTFTRQEIIRANKLQHLDIGWYRVHVHLPSTATNVMLVMGASTGKYQTFVNGIQVAGPATLNGSSGIAVFSSTNYRLPQEALQNSHGDLVLALRVKAWHVFGHDSGLQPIHSVHLVSAGAAPRDTSYNVSHDILAIVINGALAFLVGCVSLALYLAMRTRREYLTGAVTLMLGSALLLHRTVLFIQPTDYTFYGAVQAILISAWLVANIEFVRIMLARRLTHLILLVEALVFFGQLTSFLLNFVPQALSQKSLPTALFYYGSPAIAYVLELAFLIPACRRRNVDALVLLPILCVSFVDVSWNMCGSILGILRVPVHLGTLPSVHIASYVFDFNDLDSFFFPIGVLLFLVLRAVRIARERAWVGAEIGAARSVQQLLLARSSEPMPGFEVESVYLPATEVGGDFFLVSPKPENDSLMAIVGDVSGKGLSAAMRVSMILGVLRREESREPATILYHLNDALHAQGGDGFTTACCIQLLRDGSYRVANAGHISPYLNGHEAETLPGLPLGLVRGQIYEECVGQLTKGAKIVMMTDGVVEARDKGGELYGFDRLHALTLKTAQEIAAIAQAFGQDDDITVLTLACRD